MALSRPGFGLEDFPTEIVEAIVLQLDLTAIGNLRLSSRVLATKASGGSYKSCFRSRTVCWNSPDSLPSFAAATAPGGLTTLLEDLTIVGSLGFDFKHGIEEAIRLLTEALSNLRCAVPNYRLASLNVSIRGSRESPRTTYHYQVQPGDWKSRWECATRTFECALTALSKSGIHLSRLDIFSSQDGWVLAMDQACSVIAATSLSNVLFSLQEISLSLSRSVIWKQGREASADICEDMAQGRDLARLLNASTDLRTLELRWYNIDSTSLAPPKQKQEHHFLHKMIPLLPTRLRKLNLGGIYLTETSLMSFLKDNCQLLQSVSLNELRLEEGSFRAFFNALVRLTKLEHIKLDNLFERRLICFVDVPGECYVITDDESDGPNFLERRGPEVRKRIDYFRLRGTILGSAKAANWRRRRRKAFGPTIAISPDCM